MRVGIVNDMALAREALRRLTVSVPGNEVAWLAADGAQAVQEAKRLRPDLILMDLVMPVVDGAEATRRIMAECPCPIVIVTSSVVGNMSKVYEAMGHGAIDAVDTPTLGAAGALDGGAPLLRKMAMVAKLNGVARPRCPEESASQSERPRADLRPEGPLVAVGASTGGPNALDALLRGLPADFSAPIVIIQHVDLAFAPGLASWLSERSGRRVRVAREGERPGRGDLLVASTNDHLVLDRRLAFRYTEAPADACYRPSVDVFFQSLAAHWPGTGVAVLLTGMGRDGAQGMKLLRDAGWLTIAQDRASSVIWGMPRAAVELGAASRVLPLNDISAAVAEGASRRGHSEKVLT